jgi:hypothetical protein
LLIREASELTVDTLWSYYDRLKKELHPHKDDIKTFANLFKKLIDDPKNSKDLLMNNFYDFWGGIEHEILPKLSPEDQEEVLNYFGRLNIKSPMYKDFKYLKNIHKFTSQSDFDDFIDHILDNKYRSISSFMPVLMNPSYRHFWNNVDLDKKKEIELALRKEKEKMDKQPSLSAFLQDMFKKLKDNPG